MSTICRESRETQTPKPASTAARVDTVGITRCFYVVIVRLQCSWKRTPSTFFLGDWVGTLGHSKGVTLTGCYGMSLSGNASVATLLNADWLSSRVCCRKVEIFQLEQHLTRRKIRERARRPCPAAGTGMPRCKSDFDAPQIKFCCPFSRQQMLRQQSRNASLHSL